MGRATYHDMAEDWPSSTEVFAAPMNQIPKVDWEGSRVVSGDLVEEISRLRQQSGKDILAHGGASFAQSLSSLGLVDEYRLIVHPVVLGSGLPLFASPMDLTLVTTTAFSGGAVAHVYRPV